MEIILLTLILVFGYLLTIILVEKIHLLERFGLSFLLGLGISTLVVFCYSLAGVKINLYSVLATLIILNLILFIIVKFLHRKIIYVVQVDKLTKFEKIIAILIAILMIGSLVMASYFPVYIWDALALYDFRGKIIAELGYYTQIAKNYYWFDGYPLFTSLAHTFIYLSGGKNPQFLYSLMYISFILIFYGALRQIVSRKSALIASLMLASTPIIFDHSTFAYTNLPYSIFLSMGTIYLFIWFYKNKSIGYLILASLMTGLSTWTRSTEPFWMINLVFLLILVILRFKKNIIPFFAYLVSFLLIREPWSFANYYLLNVNPSVTKAPLVVTEAQSYVSAIVGMQFNLTRIQEVVVFMYKNVITSWYPLLFLFLLMILINFRKIFKQKISVFLLIIILYFGFLVYATYVYSFGVSYWAEIPDSARRMAMFFMPMMIYYIGLSIDQINIKKIWKKQ